jgi:predicted DNA-binding protein (UPF0251 family)
MPLSPLEAASRINEQVTVEMLVRAAKNCPHCSQIFLDSEQDHHDPKNMAVAVTETGAARFKGARVDDPALHFKGKTIRATGIVTLKDNRPRLPEDEREVFGLHYYHNLSQDEVAAALGVSTRTVQRRWAAALRRLHSLLKREQDNSQVLRVLWTNPRSEKTSDNTGLLHLLRVLRVFAGAPALLPYCMSVPPTASLARQVGGTRLAGQTPPTTSSPSTPSRCTA